MIRIAIVDDEEKDLLYINKKIKEHFELKNLKYNSVLYISAKQLLQENKKNPFDVVFLDIDMPQLTGMDVATQLNIVSRKTLIVFVTNHDELVYKAYRFKAIGFIRKKYFDNEIGEMIDIILNEVCKNNHILNFYDANSIIKIDLFDVLYIKSDDHYVEFYFSGKKECIRRNLNDIETQVEHYGFIRIHSRYLVNYRYIYSIERTTIILSDSKTQLPISRNRIASTKKQFQMFSRSI